MLERPFDPGGKITTTLAAIAAPAPYTPAGGSAATLALALGLASLRKALTLSRSGRSKLTDLEITVLWSALPDTEDLVCRAEEDRAAFAALLKAMRQPKAPPRRAAINAARGPAVAIPERLLEDAVAVAHVAAQVAERGNPNLTADAAAAAELALAAGQVAQLNARANQPRGERKDYGDLLQRLNAAARRARQACQR